MKAEQTTSSRFWLTSTETVEVQLTILFQLQQEDGSNVDTELSYEPLLFPDDWPVQDTLHQKLYNAVHHGLAWVRLSLPAECLSFNITQLKVTPELESLKDEDIDRIGDLLMELVSGTVASLWSGSIALKNN